MKPSTLALILTMGVVIFVLSACGTTVNMNVPQPNLHTLNLGQPNCHMDCHTTHTATQSIGDGDVMHGTYDPTAKDICAGGDWVR